MKVEEYLSWTVPQTFIAKVLGLTQGRISQLLAEGIFVRDEEIYDILTELSSDIEEGKAEYSNSAIETDDD